jgi:hypothetical protein
MGHRIIAHIIQKVTVYDIADGIGFAGVCEIPTDGFGP